MYDAAHIYLDNNATTRLDDEVLGAMQPFLRDFYANPSSPYTFARHAAEAVEEAREHVASLAGAAPSEIVFTSGGTESNNLAIRGALELQPGKRTIVSSTVEHASVRTLLLQLEQRGYRIHWIPVNRDGELDLALLEAALTEDTALVTVMTANNETGLLFPVDEIARLAAAKRILFHTDAVQVPGKIPWPAGARAAGAVSVCSHKYHGPKGIGALCVRTSSSSWPAQIFGGGQEQGRRAGTENVAAIVGMGKASQLAGAHLHEVRARVGAMRDWMEGELLERILDLRITGRGRPRLPNTSHLMISGVETEALLMKLDLAGFCLSSGSACQSGAPEKSHVLAAMGLDGGKRTGVLRISLSRMTRDSDVESLVQQLPIIVDMLRR